MGERGYRGCKFWQLYDLIFCDFCSVLIYFKFVVDD